MHILEVTELRILCNTCRILFNEICNSNTVMYFKTNTKRKNSSYDTRLHTTVERSTKHQCEQREIRTIFSSIHPVPFQASVLINRCVILSILCCMTSS